MTRLTELAVGKRSVVLLLAFGLFFAGVFAWGQLKQELLPDVEFPIVTVIAPYPGAGATDVTEQVVKPVERAIANVPRLESLQATAANSLGIVVAQFSFGTNVKETRAAIEQNLANAGLPSGVEPRVTSLNINTQPVYIASIQAAGDQSLDDVALIARTVIGPELAGIEGITSVDVTGGLDPRLYITFDPAKMAEAGVSIQQVNGILQANNLTLPSGQLDVDGQTVPVSTSYRFASLDDLEGLIVGVRSAASGGFPGAGGSPGAITPPVSVRLGDIATVEVVRVATTGYSRTNGRESVSLTVSKAADANTVTVAEAVREKLDEIRAEQAGKVQITTVQDLSTFIEQSRDGLLNEGGVGAVFAILVIFAFLLSVRSTLVAAVSIPLSILAALVLMLATGITLNIMTLGGLAVAVGRVVDDAIVVLENIYRHRARGEEIHVAIVAGTREVASAITSSTFTTVGVFLPLGFVGGLVSEFFLPFALTITFALFASLLVALTVIPVLAYFLVASVKLQLGPDGEPRMTLLERVYIRTLGIVLRSRGTRWGVLGAMVALFVATSALLPLIPTAFINSGSEKILTVTVSPPVGTASSVVAERAAQVEKLLQGDPEVTLTQSTIPGEGDTGFQTLFAAQSGRAANGALMFVRLRPEVDLATKKAQLLEKLAPLGAGGFGIAVESAGGGAGTDRLSIVVSGPDAASVATAAETLLGRVRSIDGIVNLASDLVKAAPEISIAVDPNKAAAIGSSTAQIAGQVRQALVPTSVTRVQVGDEPAVALYTRLGPAAAGSLDALRVLPVGTVAAVPLGGVAKVELVEVQSRITRISQAPAATVSGEIASADQGAVSGAVRAAIDELEAAGGIPAGVDVRLAGVSQQQSEAFAGLFFAMGVAILLVYVFMVLAFNSLVDPFIILFTLPLATIGAFPALFVTQRPIGISALIGFLLLIGIVVTNAIVLLDRVEQLRAKGMGPKEALIAGGRTRVRPVLMTALATILALFPLGLGLNEGSIIASELATVVIGGLLSSTILTLIVIPIVYSLLAGGKEMVRRGGATAEG